MGGGKFQIKDEKNIRKILFGIQNLQFICQILQFVEKLPVNYC